MFSFFFKNNFNFFLRRCDEWYHTQCVDMPELEVDLVDQFICPPCIESAYFVLSIIAFLALSICRKS